MNKEAAINQYKKKSSRKLPDRPISAFTHELCPRACVHAAGQFYVPAMSLP